MRKEEARTILGVAEGDSDTVIKKAYRKLALKNHPDKNKGSDESKKKFQQISEAYKCLTDPNYEDEAEGFGDINEEEMFEMFNYWFLKNIYFISFIPGKTCHDICPFLYHVEQVCLHAW